MAWLSRRRAGLGVFPHPVPLVWGQRTGLVEDLGRELGLAYVVEETGQPDASSDLIRQSELPGRELGEPRHTTRVVI